MSYPLIQNPAPLQQLADTINAIRQARQARQAFEDERRLAAARDARAQQYLDMAQAQHANRVTQQALDNRIALTELGMRQEDAALRRRTMEMEAALERRRQYISERIPQAIAGRMLGIGDMVDRISAAQAAPQALAVAGQALGGVAGQALTEASRTALPAPNLADEARQAVASYQPARQGSVQPRPEVPGTSPGGLTYIGGETLNYNAPAGGGGGAGRRNEIGQRYAIGATLMNRVVSNVNEVSADPTSSEVPIVTDVGGSLAEHLLGTTAGGHLAARIRNRGIMGLGAMTDNQQKYQAAREQFKHSMAVFYPRAAIALMNNLADSYFGVPGESEASRRQKLDDLNIVNATIQAITRGEAPPEALDAIIAQRLPAEQQLEFLNARPATAAPEGFDPQSASPTQPTADDWLRRLRGRTP